MSTFIGVAVAILVAQAVVPSDAAATRIHVGGVDIDGVRDGTETSPFSSVFEAQQGSHFSYPLSH